MLIEEEPPEGKAGGRLVQFDMSHRWLLAKVWRYRVAGLMVILCATSLLILVGTHVLQHSRYVNSVQYMLEFFLYFCFYSIQFLYVNNKMSSANPIFVFLAIVICTKVGERCH